MKKWQDRNVYDKWQERGRVGSGRRYMLLELIPCSLHDIRILLSHLLRYSCLMHPTLRTHKHTTLSSSPLSLSGQTPVSTTNGHTHNLKFIVRSRAHRLNEFLTLSLHSLSVNKHTHTYTTEPAYLDIYLLQ